MKKNNKICSVNKSNFLKIFLYLIFIYPFTFKKQQKYIDQFINFCFDYKRFDDFINTYEQHLDDLKNKNINKALIKKEQIKEFELTNQHGEISCLKITNNHSKKWVIGLHGWTENKYLALRLVQQFLKDDYNILTFDQFAHGKSYGEFTDTGQSTIEMIDTVIKYLKEIEQAQEIGMIGNSMGASTSVLFAQTSNYKNQINWIVADCGFSNLIRQFRWYMSTQLFKKDWWKISIGVAKKFNKHVSTDVRNYDLLKKMNQVKTPILFIHSKGDTFINYLMSVEMYQKANQDITFIWTPPKSEHVRTIAEYPEKYYKEVKKFIKRTMHKIS
ncbi:alpha/beta hydrolase [Mycoplasma putrefaciens]|uniref:Hydrolase n=1 Tax=Mycoplasma putrefaciens (strain ATCC 15718 / NCTC 10155 / C30 KS-1 / KS-1) TaxID=743965 RepID=A0A7U4E9Z2_MYCPK|nr:alpha/beta fold hydrolase [Mycoplasma putrefaciens]AEM69000.1 putative hydrolase [Mycoplasma putrefaciens KS1]